MLVRRDDEGALAIGQLSHAWLSGHLARAWGNDEFPAPDPREEIALGAEQHDIGWALFDLRPGLSAKSGLPRDFLELSVEEHLAIWSDAPDHLLSQSQHAALVVSLHGCSLSELRARGGPPAIELCTSGDGAFTLDPWPFSQPRVEVRCEARRLLAAYEDEREMQRALDASELVTLEFELLPAA